MDTLKKILRDGLAAGAQRLRLQSGLPIELTDAHGTTALAGTPSVDDAYIGKLFQFLFPNDKAAIAAGQTVKGALSIPQVGKLLLIAQPVAPFSLRIFVPPGGQELFDSDWQKIAGQTVSIAAPLPTVPAAAPPIAAATPVVAAPAPSPTGDTSTPLPAGVDLFGGPSPGLAKKASAKTEIPVANAMAPASGVPMPLATSAPMAPAGFAPAPPPASQHAAAVAPPITVIDAPVRIDFQADSSAGDVSNGQNAIDPILTEMIRRKASDLHMTSNEPYCFRVDGEITRIGKEPLTPDDMAAYLLPIIPPRNQAEFVKINDTDFAYEIRGIGRFRVNVFRDRTGVGTVMRHIPSKILTAEQLGLPPAITKFCSLSKGLVVVTGPTGSGKSTTLAAMIDLINKTRHDHILTIEDPIEFVHPQQLCLVNQREVHKHTGSFSRALKAALREDPDIVLIGEMRDLETVAIAIETAETGHLVFGTLHTNTAVSTIDRIIDQFSSDQQSQIRQMLASSLKGVVAQTLLKKKGGGRVAAHEILVVNDAVSAMIREAKNHMIPNHMQSQKQDGNVLLTETLARLVKEDKIEPEDAFRKAVDKSSLIDAFKRMGIKVNEGVAPPPATPPAVPGLKKPA